MSLYHVVLYTVLFIPCMVYGQLGADIIEFQGVKYLHFPNPCRLDDQYCPLTCAQKYQSAENVTGGLCVECICTGDHGGVAELTTSILTTPTTTTPLTTTAHFAVVVEHGSIYLKLSAPCDISQSLCPVDCFVDSVTPDNSNSECQVCNCSARTTAGTSPESHQLTTAGTTTAPVRTTTANKEIVMIGGVANLLIDLPCTPRDNICPINQCVVNGVVKDTEGLCFQCECVQPTKPPVATTTEPPTSPSTNSAQANIGSTGDTLVVGGVLQFIVSNPCSTQDNLCPVEGCTVDLVTQGNGICFQCTCSTAATTKVLTTSTQSVTTTESSGLQTVMIGGKEYTMLQNACTPRDNLCPTAVCHIEAHVSADKSVCFGCHC